MIYPPSKLEIVTRKYSGQLEQTPVFQQKIRGMNTNQVKAFLHQLSRAGIRRLPDSDLNSWNQIRIKLATSSKELCAGFWTGKLNNTTFQSAITKLPEAEIDIWVKLSFESMRLELEVKGESPEVPNTLQESLMLVSAKLPQAERQRMQKLLVANGKNTEEEACWGLLTLLRVTDRLQNPDKEKVLRSLAAL